jgi:hypothetical protein
LTTAERTLFAELIGACDARHFVRSDLPLLISYIQATLLARRLAVKLSKNDPSVVASWERADRVQAMLATRLRLAPQARTDPKTIARMQQNGTAPWQQEERSEEW